MVIKGGEILAIGDLHISDVFEGKHINYLENCFKVLRQLKDIIYERKPSAVVFLGDLVGWNETNIKSRAVLAMLCDFFKSINEVSHVFAVRGNHDMKGYPDFQFLASLGLIDVTSSFDYVRPDGGTELRFHLVNYGEEDRHLDTIEEGNVVFGHNNYTIDGVTNWYQSHDGIELVTLQNFSEVDMVISGHIHNPSPEMVSVTMPSEKVCALFYVGCPTRPIKINDNYNQVWLASFEYNEETEETDYDMIPFELEPYESLYYSDDEVINEKTEKEVEEELRKEALAEVLGDIMKYRMLQGDYMKQIDVIPNASDEAKQVAKDYLQVALNNERRA